MDNKQRKQAGTELWQAQESLELPVSYSIIVYYVFWAL